jgi:hypothetical protein
VRPLPGGTPSKRVGRGGGGALGGLGGEGGGGGGGGGLHAMHASHCAWRSASEREKPKLHASHAAVHGSGGGAGVQIDGSFSLAHGKHVGSRHSKVQKPSYAKHKSGGKKNRQEMHAVQAAALPSVVGPKQVSHTESHTVVGEGVGAVGGVGGGGGRRGGGARAVQKGEAPGVLGHRRGQQMNWFPTDGNFVSGGCRNSQRWL